MNNPFFFNDNNNKIYYQIFSIGYASLKKNKAADHTKKS